MTTDNSTKPRVAFYARVSTKRLGQDPETQLVALREYQNVKGLQVFNEYVDVGISGSKENRPVLDQLMKYARRRYLSNS